MKITKDFIPRTGCCKKDGHIIADDKETLDTWLQHFKKLLNPQVLGNTDQDADKSTVPVKDPNDNP